MTTMPVSTRPVIAAGRFRESAQPRIEVDAELGLRPWADGDASAVLAAYQDPATQRWHARTLTGEQEARELLTGWRRGWSEETGASWAVVGRGDEVLGRIAVCGMNLHEAVAGIAYWTSPRARGRGVAPRAVRAVTRWAVEEVGFHRLELQHSTRNEASCRVARKAGFRTEGTRASAALHEDGWHDMHVHVVLGTDPLTAASTS